MGLIVDVYRNAFQDCTNGGISSKAKGLCLVNVEGPSQPSVDAPAALLVQNTEGTVRIVPAAKVQDFWIPASGWWMNGGNYGATSDSRFSQAVERILRHAFYGAVAIHDRQE